MITTPWVWTWGLALAVIAVAKVVIGREYGRVSLQWWGWPGMNPEQFHAEPVLAPAADEVERTALYMAIGALLLWGVVPACGHDHVAALLGAVGLALLLHFGVARLVSIYWRARGHDARPLFDRPFAARSLGEFWGRRWNRAFSDAAQRWIFRPLAPRVGVRWASAAVFVASGLGHDLLLSVPAGGWIGSCTVYFVLQWCGLVLERAWRRTRWLTLAFVILPAPLLFHPPLLERVVLPFLQVIGAVS